MKRVVFLFSLLILLAGCGDSAPEDAVVTAPSDSTNTIAAIDPAVFVFRPLEFKVTKPAETGTIPVPDIDIEFFSGGTAFLSDLAGTPIGDAVGRVKSKTGDNGVGTISVSITVPLCPTPPANVTTTGTVLGTVGSSSALWTGTMTRTCPAAAGP